MMSDEEAKYYRYNALQKQILEGMKRLIDRELSPKAYHGSTFDTTIKELEDGVEAIRLIQNKGNH